MKHTADTALTKRLRGLLAILRSEATTAYDRQMRLEASGHGAEAVAFQAQGRAYTEAHDRLLDILEAADGSD